MSRIIAIGGGKIRKGETLPIDKEIVRRVNKKHPRLLFVPTASSDSEEYCSYVQNYFGKRLGCVVDLLLLVDNPPPQKEIRKKITSADIIYVGGGNTLKMMRLWRRLEVDKLLKEAYQKGVILCGLSAGSICWFEAGHSDSLSYYNPKDWRYIKVKGLGFLRGINCPHYDSHTLHVARKEKFKDMIRNEGGWGIAIENNCALEIIDGKYFRLLRAKRGAKAYKVYRRGGRVLSEAIPAKNKPSAIAELYKESLS